MNNRRFWLDLVYPEFAVFLMQPCKDNILLLEQFSAVRVKSVFSVTTAYDHSFLTLFSADF